MGLIVIRFRTGMRRIRRVIVLSVSHFSAAELERFIVFNGSRHWEPRGAEANNESNVLF